MQKYLAYATDTAGNVVSTASVRVKIAGTAVDATIYSDDGITEKLNPFDVESNDGSYYFYAANGLYDITLTASGYTFDDDDTAGLSLFDADDGVGIHPVKAYGLKGDGVTAEDVAFQALLDTVGQNANIVFTEGEYLFTSGEFQLSSNTTITMRRGATLIKAFNGNLFVVDGDNFEFDSIVVDLQGDTYTGPCILFKADSSNVHLHGGRYMDGEDSIFLFEDNGAQYSSFHDFYFNIHTNNVTTGSCIKRTSATPDTLSPARHFHHILSGAYSWWAIDLNGAEGMYFDHIYSAGITIGDACLGCTINNCRLAVPAGMTAHISGNSTLMTACEIGGDLTIDAGFTYGEFSGNEMDPSKTFTDNSIKTPGDSTPLVENPITPSVNRLYLGPKTATTSGTSFAFTGLPPGLKRITLMFSGLSLSGTDNLRVRLGDAGGVETTGYLSASSDEAGTVISSTTHFVITSGNAANVISGALTLELIDAATFSWIAHGTFKLSATKMAYVAGDKALSQELTQIQITTTGTDTFDAGSINISYQR